MTQCTDISANDSRG